MTKKTRARRNRRLETAKTEIQAARAALFRAASALISAGRCQPEVHDTDIANSIIDAIERRIDTRIARADKRDD